jgi:hypothetical protein
MPNNNEVPLIPSDAVKAIQDSFREKIGLMNFEEYKAEVERVRVDCPEWRSGEAAFNVLLGYRPDLAKQIDGTEYDPYSRNDLCVNFWQWAADHWNE